MIRARFYANGADYRPVEWPIKYPYWCSGYTSKNESVIIAYADSTDDIKKLWPEAHDIEWEEADEITYTSRFPKPSWYNKDMKLNEYQQKAMTTCMASCDNFAYMMLNLVGELGEFASKVAKQIRKGNKEIKENELVTARQGTGMDHSEFEAELRKEAGDMLWQLAGLCHVMGWDLEDVAAENLEKLAARKKAGTIDGDGDGIIR